MAITDKGLCDRHQAARKRQETAGQPRPVRVLLVEDETVLVEVFADALAARGHRVRVARDGLQAMHALRKGPPELVVLDLGLPVVPGVEILRALACGPPPRPRVLVLSGAGPEDLSCDLGEAAPDAWLRKPCRPEELLAAVDGLMGSS